MDKTYKWTTAKGAEVEMTIVVEHITKETVFSDGWHGEIKCNHWYREITLMRVNGKQTKLKQLWNEKGMECVLIERIGKDRVLVLLPKEVEEEIYGEERRDIEERTRRSIALEKEYWAERKKVEDAMNM